MKPVKCQVFVVGICDRVANRVTVVPLTGIIKKRRKIQFRDADLETRNIFQVFFAGLSEAAIIGFEQSRSPFCSVSSDKSGNVADSEGGYMFE
jgi:hypothetical protein